MKWEYKKILLMHPTDIQIEVLNTLGEDSWEAVCHEEEIWIFKREKRFSKEEWDEMGKRALEDSLAQVRAMR